MRKERQSQSYKASDWRSLLIGRLHDKVCWPFISCGLIGAFAIAALAGAPVADPKIEQFKHDMLPQVGHKITFTGTITSGKFGPYVRPDDGVGIFIEPTTTNSNDLVKLSEIYRLQGRVVS